MLFLFWSDECPCGAALLFADAKLGENAPQQVVR